MNLESRLSISIKEFGANCHEQGVMVFGRVIHRARDFVSVQDISVIVSALSTFSFPNLTMRNDWLVQSII